MNEEIEEQSGFWADTSCQDNINTLEQLIEKQSEKNLNTHQSIY